MKRSKEYIFDITGTEFPGMGTAEYEGEEVCIKRALPGQKVKAQVTKKKAGKFHAKLKEIIEDVDYKIEPKCPHFEDCGGCTHQFITYDKQIELKKMQVLKLFKEANIKDFNFLGIEKSPCIWEYRNKMEFSFGDLEKDGELCLGMHKRNASFSILNTENCQIVDRDFRTILDFVVKYFREKKFPFYRVMSHKGYLRNLVIRKGKNTNEILINLVTTSQIDFNLDEFSNMLLNLNYDGEIKGIIHTINDSLSNTVQADSVEILYGRDYIYEKILGLKFKISPFSFFQTNSNGAAELYSIVKDFLGNCDNKVVFDLYCGTGTIGQIVAPNAKKVIGVELIEEAVEAAKENAKLNGLDNCEFIAGDVAKIIKDINVKPDVIILDPPRPGITPKAMDYVIKFNANEIIYVSCNPKTLVSDLKVLIENGYAVKDVKIKDMFPSTPHVETVVLLNKMQK